MVTEGQIVQGLVARGVPLPAAIGFAANFVVESNLNPGINEIAPLVPGSRGGFGLAQWTGPRRRQLEAWTSQRGVPVSDLDAQLDFLTWELGNTERSAAQAIYGASDPVQAARLVSDRFLRPGIPHLDRRLREAQRIAGMGGDLMQQQPMPQNALAQPSAPPAPPEWRNSLAVEPFLTPRRQNALVPFQGMT